MLDFVWSAGFQLASGSEHYPRLLMTAILMLAGGIGFLATALMYLAGVETLWIRYSLSVFFGYLSYLALLGMWARQTESVTDLLDLPGTFIDHGGTVGRAVGGGFRGAGGQFGGGGATGHFGGSQLISVGWGKGLIPWEQGIHATLRVEASTYGSSQRRLP